MKKSFFSSRDAGKFFVWAVAAPQLLALAVEVLLMLIANVSGTTTDALFKIPAIAISFAMVAQVAFLLVILLNGKKHDFKLVYHFSFKIPAQNVLIAILIGVIAVFSFTPIVGLFDEFLASIGFNVATIGFPVDTVWLLLLGIVLMAFVPAVLEELIFRGAILQGFKKYGKWIAILGTSALFMLIHGNLQQLIYPFVISIIMCNCVLKTDNILTSMIVHFVANSTSLIISFAGLNLSWAMTSWFMVLLPLLVAIAGFAIMWLLSNCLKPQKEEPKTAEQVFEKIDATIEDGNLKTDSFLKVGIYLAFVFYILSVVSGFMA